jgi:hypothetical protein
VHRCPLFSRNVALTVRGNKNVVGSLAIGFKKQQKRRTSMKRNFARKTLVIISVATLYMSLVPAVRASDNGGCTNDSVAGDWGYTYTGVLLLSMGAVPVAVAGTYTADSQGNFSGTQTRSIGGMVAEERVKGKSTVGSDCRGTLRAKVYESGKFVRSAVLALVYDDNSNALRAIFKSLTLPDGTQVPVVVTVDGKKLSTKGGH